MLTATSPEGVSSSFAYDTYGNNTQVSVGGTKKVTASAATARTATSSQVSGCARADDVLRLRPADGMLQWVRAPGETESTRTNYSYDGSSAPPASARARPQWDTATQATCSRRFPRPQARITACLRRVRSGAEYSGGARGRSSATATARTAIISSRSGATATAIRCPMATTALAAPPPSAMRTARRSTIVYDNNGNLGLLTDSASGRKTQYFYGFSGSADALGTERQRGMKPRHGGYDDNTTSPRKKQTLNGTTYTTSYTYDKDNPPDENDSGERVCHVYS